MNSASCEEMLFSFHSVRPDRKVKKVEEYDYDWKEETETVCSERAWSEKPNAVLFTVCICSSSLNLRIRATATCWQGYFLFLLTQVRNVRARWLLAADLHFVPEEDDKRPSSPLVLRCWFDAGFSALIPVSDQFGGVTQPRL